MSGHAGRLLVDCLIGLGGTQGFGVPGESYLAVLDGFHDAGAAFRFTLCRNEGGAAFMAAAYGKLTGQPGLCFVTRGPGATNASIGVHTALQDSVPMILFIGQVGRDMAGREAFQEIDYRAMFGPVAKWATQIDDPARIPEILSRAWTVALSGRPGPVVVALPEDVLSAEVTARPVTGPAMPHRPGPAPEAVKQAMAQLSAAKRPLVIAGGGGWTVAGRAALQSWAEASDIPVLVSFRRQDLIDNHSPVYAGDAGVGQVPQTKALIRDADVVLALGIRFGEITTDGYTHFNVPDPVQGLIHVHASDAELGKIYRPDLAVHACPNLFAAALSPVAGAWADWRAAARQGRLDVFDLAAQPSPVDMGAVMAHLRRVLPRDAILTNGAGNFAVWPNRYFAFGPDQRLLAPQSGAMGYGLPAAIAAKLVAPDRVVVCIGGDGDFQMTCPELGTAMQAGAQPIVLIVNNGSYGTIRMHQERHYPARVSGTELQNPDFAGLARSYGFYGERVEETRDFAAAFDRALASDSGAVLDLNVSVEALTPTASLTAVRGGG